MFDYYSTIKKADRCKAIADELCHRIDTRKWSNARWIELDMLQADIYAEEYNLRADAKDYKDMISAYPY